MKFYWLRKLDKPTDELILVDENRECVRGCNYAVKHIHDLNKYEIIEVVEMNQTDEISEEYWLN